jgi:hypothetical protein
LANIVAARLQPVLQIEIPALRLKHLQAKMQAGKRIRMAVLLSSVSASAWVPRNQASNVHASSDRKRTQSVA